MHERHYTVSIHRYLSGGYATIELVAEFPKEAPVAMPFRHYLVEYEARLRSVYPWDEPPVRATYKTYDSAIVVKLTSKDIDPAVAESRLADLQTGFYKLLGEIARLYTVQQEWLERTAKRSAPLVYMD